MTPFALNGEGQADPSVLSDKKSPRVGKFTHPSGAPNNHMLTIYSPGPVNHQYNYPPQLDGGIYLIKNGDIINKPSEIRLIKNDPRYNESWPRAVVPYKAIYGVPEPKNLTPLANDGSQHKLLPEGTPFGLVGTSSFYKRETYPDGEVKEGSVTAEYPGGNDPWKGLDAFTSHGNGMPINWHKQGSDAGLYSNSEIHAVRILAMEPTTHRDRGADSGRKFYNHAEERLRILGEIPLRKFDCDGNQTDDPDGHPDTSFLAKIPADTAFTFQTIDRDGLVLNNSQTWHQLRPGEVRNDCGGCHAHSQKPTDYNLTLAAQPNYKVWDLVNTTPLLTDKKRDTSGKQWDTDKSTGLQTLETGVTSIEYHRDIRPIIDRSCVACHTKDWKKPAGNLVLDADEESIQYRHHGKFPGSYFRLALDELAEYSHKPVGYDIWGYPNASRYIRKLQARRSLLVWKIFGRRLDGFSNDDHPSESKPGSRKLLWKGQPVDEKKYRAKWDLDYVGKQMPPKAAIAGKWKGPNGKLIKVEPLSDKDRRTLVRWIDLGCTIDLDFDPSKPERPGKGWMLDDNRPILTITEPVAGHNPSLDRILIGFHDYYTGIAPSSLLVTANFSVNGSEPGVNLADKFQPLSQGVFELRLNKPLRQFNNARLSVSIQDKEVNITEIVGNFYVSQSVTRSQN